MTDQETRLIDANALIETFEHLIEKSILDDTKIHYMLAIETVKGQPTIEAEPVRHGRWLLLPNRTAPSKLFRCSECGGGTEHKYFSRNGYYPFCKDCGAKMDKTDGGEEK